MKPDWMKAAPVSTAPRVTAAQFRSRFILVCVLFGVVISFTGIANLYIQGINEKLDQILRQHQEQCSISRKISDKFRFLLNNGDSLSKKTLNKFEQDLYDDFEALRASQSNLEKIVADAVQSYYFLWPSDLNLKSVQVTEKESKFIERMLRTLKPPSGYASSEYIFFSRPLESNIVLQSAWRVRLANTINLVQKNNRYFSKLNQYVLLSTFLGLLAILFIAYFTLFSPMFVKLRLASENSQLKIDTHEALANFLRDVSNIGYKLVENPNALSNLLNQKINQYPVLNGISISVVSADMDTVVFKNRTVIEGIKHAGAADYRLLVSLPSSLTSVEADIRPFVKALANHLGTLFEVQLRMTVEYQRDMYYQVADSTFKALPSPIAIFDDGGIGIMANLAFTSLFELSGLEAIAQSSLEQIECKHRNMQQAAAKHYSEVFVPGPAVEFNVAYEQNALVWTRLPVTEIGYVFIGHDVTEIRKHLSREEHHRSLEYLGQMAGSVAHDTNNFLAVIMNTMEIIGMATKLDDKLEELLQVAISTCQKASSMNRHLVSFARKQHLAPDRVTPESLLRKVELFLANEHYRHIKLVTHIDESALIFADPVYLENAVINIVKNGVESMDGEGVLGLNILPSSADMISVCIKDTGPGFTDNDFKQALEPFYSNKASGAGLGLAAVYGFANQSNGSLRLTNETGAVVELQLPRYRVSLNQRSWEQLSSAGPMQLPKKGLDIFLLEDNLALLELISSQLSNVGHRVKTADSLNAAETVLQELTSMDVMVSDIIFPDGRGFSAIDHARKLFPDVKLIYTTGYGTSSFTDEFNKNPGLVLEKPFHINRLIQHIDEYAASRSKVA